MSKKNDIWPFYPFTKSCRELKLSSSGVIFRDGAANNAQKFIAPPKQLVLDLTLHLHGDVLLRKFHPNFFVGVKKWNVGDRLKRVLAKFEAKRSHPWGVNGCSKFARKLKKLCFWRQKTKCEESSETRFGKVWGRLEPCLTGKRPFKVANSFRNSRTGCFSVVFWPYVWHKKLPWYVM